MLVPGLRFFLSAAILFSCLLTPINLHADLLTCGCQYTIRHLNMGHAEFILAAVERIKTITPEWYIANSEEAPVILKADPELDKYFGTTWKDKEGTLITFGRHSLHLATVEDLSHIALHEYVHAKIWDDVAEKPWSDICKHAYHELMANKIALQYSVKLGNSAHMNINAIILYTAAYTEAVINLCPTEVTKDMPVIEISGEIPLRVVPF